MMMRRVWRILEMPIEVQRHAHHYLSQLVAAAGGEGQLLRGMMLMTRRAIVTPSAQTK